VSGLRVGVMEEGFTGAEDDVAETVKAAVNSLKQLGVTVEEFSYPPLSDCKSSLMRAVWDGISYSIGLAIQTSAVRFW